MSLKPTASEVLALKQIERKCSLLFYRSHINCCGGNSKIDGSLDIMRRLWTRQGSSDQQQDHNAKPKLAQKLKSGALKIWREHKSYLAWSLYTLAIAAFLAIPLGGKDGYTDEKSLLLGSTTAVFRQTAVPAIVNSIYPQLIASSTSSSSSTTNLTQLIAHASSLTSSPSAPEPPSQWHASSSSTSSSTSNTQQQQPQQNKNCIAVHSVVPSTRGDGTESIALVLHVNTQNNIHAAALAVAVGVYTKKLLEEAKWLAKDVVVVFVDTTTTTCSADIAIEEWINQYNNPSKSQTPSSSSSSSFLFPRAGSIQQAILLDIQSPNINHAEIRVLGHSGRLPNFDLYWVLRKNLEYYTQLPASIHPSSSVSGSGGSSSVNRYIQELYTAVLQASYAAVGRSTGPHAAFLDHIIDSATVSFIDTNNTANAKNKNKNNDDIDSVSLEHSATYLISYIEATLRTCNNLQERLHHSSAMYLLLSTDKFAPVGVVLVAPLLMLFASIVTVSIPILKLQNIVVVASSSAVVNGDGSDGSSIKEKGTVEVGGGGGKERGLSSNVWYKAWKDGVSAQLVLVVGVVGVRYIYSGSSSSGTGSMVLMQLVGLVSSVYGTYQSYPALLAAMADTSSGSSSKLSGGGGSSNNNNSNDDIEKAAFATVFLSIWVAKLTALLLSHWSLGVFLSILLLPCTLLLLL